MNKKFLVEGIGTFGLALVVTLGLSGQFPVSVPLLAGLTLALFVYSIGHISGCHINPAVTLGLLSIKKIDAREALGYLISQFIGAFLASFVAVQLGAKILPTANDSVAIALAEAIGTAFFTFGIASVVFGRVEKAASGIVVGGSLVFGIALSALAGAAGVLNPAVALSIHLFTPMYILGPVLGSLVGFNLYAWLEQRK